MPLLRENITIDVNGKPRRIAAIRENSKGDVYISYFGMRLGDAIDGPELQEQRISLHPSWQSQTPTSIIKFQVRGRGGEYFDRVAATNSTRNLSEHRFHLAMTMRLTDLSAVCYDFDPLKRKGETQHEYGEFTPKSQTAFLSTIVGAPYIPFPRQDCIRLRSRAVQIVLYLDLLHGIPASLHAQDLIASTIRPDTIENFEARVVMESIIEGFWPTDILAFKDWAIRRLGIHALRQLRSIYKIDFPEFLTEREASLFDEGERLRAQLPAALQLSLPATDQFQEENSGIPLDPTQD